MTAYAPPRRSSPRRVPAALWPFILADIVLRVVAVARALRLRQARWALALAMVSSGGVLPALYLLHFSERPSTRAEDAAALS